jgi:hypothetical protein
MGVGASNEPIAELARAPTAKRRSSGYSLSLNGMYATRIFAMVPSCV